MVPDERIIEELIEVIYVSAPSGKTIVTHPRTVLVAGQRSQVTLLERYLEVANTGAAGNEVYLTNAVAEIAASRR